MWFAPCMFGDFLPVNDVLEICSISRLNVKNKGGRHGRCMSEHAREALDRLSLCDLRPAGDRMGREEDVTNAAFGPFPRPK